MDNISDAPSIDTRHDTFDVHNYSGKQATNMILNNSYTYFRVRHINNHHTNTKTSKRDSNVNDSTIARPITTTYKRHKYIYRYIHCTFTPYNRSSHLLSIHPALYRVSHSHTHTTYSSDTQLIGTHAINDNNTQHLHTTWPTPITNSLFNDISVGNDDMIYENISSDQRALIDKYRCDERSRYYTISDMLNPDFKYVFEMRELLTGNCNLFDIFKHRCIEHGNNRRVMSWCDDKGRLVIDMTYQQMYERVRNLAYALHHIHNASANDRVLLCYPPSLDFFVAFWSCLSLNLIPVPVAPIDPFADNSDAEKKFRSIVNDSQPTLMLTNNEYITAIAAARAFKNMSNDDNNNQFNIFNTRWISTDAYMYNNKNNTEYECVHYDNDGNKLAFLQYTSGNVHCNC